MRNLILIVILSACLHSGLSQKRAIHPKFIPGIWELSIQQKDSIENSVNLAVSRYLIFEPSGIFARSDSRPDTTRIKVAYQKFPDGSKDTIIIPSCFYTPALSTEFRFHQWNIKRRKLTLTYVIPSGMTTNPQVPLRTYYKTQTETGKIICLNEKEMVVKFDNITYTYKRIAQSPMLPLLNLTIW